MISTRPMRKSTPPTGWRDRLSRWARRLKRETRAVVRAARDPRVGWPVRLLALAVAAYALSPIDLIPDFIPVLGLLDDLILVPLGLWLVIRLLPPDILDEHRRAVADLGPAPVSRAGAVAVVALWVVGGLAFGWIVWRHVLD